MAEVTTREKIKRWAEKQGWLFLNEVETNQAVILRFLLPDGKVKVCVYHPDEYVGGTWEMARIEGSDKIIGEMTVAEFVQELLGHFPEIVEVYQKASLKLMDEFLGIEE